jgi:hypothetical protein
MNFLSHLSITNNFKQQICFPKPVFFHEAGQPPQRYLACAEEPKNVKNQRTGVV